MSPKSILAPGPWLVKPHEDTVWPAARSPRAFSAAAANAGAGGVAPCAWQPQRMMAGSWWVSRVSFLASGRDHSEAFFWVVCIRLEPRLPTVETWLPARPREHPDAGGRSWRLDLAVGAGLQLQGWTAHQTCDELRPGPCQATSVPPPAT